MKIGIIGSGQVGQSLAKGFIRAGEAVMIGSNDPKKRDNLKNVLGGQAETGSFDETARFGEVIVLAVKGAAAESVLRLAGPAHLAGKAVLDATNPIADREPKNGVLAFFTSANESLMERLQSLAPEARFVKAFSCIGAGLMVNPDFNGEKPTMFICGNDAGAKETATRIIERFGFATEDLGGAEAARAIEPLCILWCIPGFQKNEWTHAFKLLRK